MSDESWTSMTRGLVRLQVVNRVAWLELHNPPANNYSFDMMCDLDQAILQCRMNDEVDVLVLCGEGDRFFCAGADIHMLTSVTPRWKYSFCLHANETMLRLEHTPKLVIAALNGHCVGGGLEVALAADIRIGRSAAEGGKPFSIGLPEVKLGVLPGTGGTQRLGRLLGQSKAMEMMISAQMFPPEKALEKGLLHQVLPFEGFREGIQSYAEGFTAPHVAPMAVGNIKRAVQSGCGLPLESGLALERELQQRLFESEDAGEGLAAFLEKRPAEFQGK